MYADVEALLVTYIGGITGIAGASVELPNMPSLPFALITRIGGGDDYITDSPQVDIDIFNTTRATALATARIVHAQMMELRHTAVNGVLVDHVETITGPMWVNYQDETLQRYVASYRVDSRVVAQ
ncbi:MAG: hypothetical protein ACRDRN_26470 [Sciscionella sp.]